MSVFKPGDRVRILAKSYIGITGEVRGVNARGFVVSFPGPGGYTENRTTFKAYELEPVDAAEERMDIIGQNGNDGEHYDPKTRPEREPSQVQRTLDYASLNLVLERAYDQAASGKGAQRHAGGQAFEDQPMQKLIELYGLGFALGQAGKKMQESRRLGTEAAVRELLGAINYIAGAIIHLEKK